MALRSLPFLIIALDVAVCVGAALAGGNRPNRYFVEGEFITWIDGVQLLVVAALAAATYRGRAGQLDPAGARFWLWAALGSLFLAFDETLQLHETLGHALKEADAPRPPLVNGFGDAILIAYGLVAVAVCWVYRREVLADGGALPFFIAGAALVALSQLVDTFGVHQGRERFWWSVTEESAKLIGFGAILGGMLLRWQSTRAAPQVTQPLTSS